MKVSVIVAAYNLENEIEKCLQSLHEQTMAETEFLIIDDGSTDNTATVIKNYLNKVNDARFKYLYKQNGGQSDARNYGLNYATGEYIWFVDGDDTVVGTNSLQKLYQHAHDNNLDILVFNFKFNNKWNDKYANKVGLPNIDNNKLLTGITIINEKLFNFSVWHMLYQKDFLKTNNFKFKQGSMAEDLLFNMQVFIKAQRTMFTNIIGYCYHYRANSITKTTDKQMKIRRLQDVLTITTMADNLLRKYHISEQSNLANSLVRSYLSSLIEGCVTGYLSVSRQDIKQFMQGKKLGFKEKIKVFVFVYCPRFIQKWFCTKILGY